MNNYLALRVARVIEETADARSLVFGAGWGFIAAGRRAGQADIDALSALIEGALRAPAAEQGPP